MGYTEYNVGARTRRANLVGYTDPTVASSSIFRNRSMPVDMDPKRIRLREARDSDAHPESYPVIIALDQTGSMGHIPRDLIANGLPHIVEQCQQAGIPDVAILFTAIGDHSGHGDWRGSASFEEAPLQIGQFESGDEELDYWLTSVFLEGKGGGNRGESYLLAWMVGAFITETDHWDKRHQKGTLITIGDESCLPGIVESDIRRIFGNGFLEDQPGLREGITADAAFRRASEKWDIHHIHCKDGSYGSMPVNGWNLMIGSGRIHDVTSDAVPGKIADIIKRNFEASQPVSQASADKTSG